MNTEKKYVFNTTNIISPLRPKSPQQHKKTLINKSRNKSEDFIKRAMNVLSVSYRIVSKNLSVYYSKNYLKFVN